MSLLFIKQFTHHFNNYPIQQDCMIRFHENKSIQEITICYKGVVIIYNRVGVWWNSRNRLPPSTITSSIFGHWNLCPSINYDRSRTKKAYLRLESVWIRTFGPRKLRLWVSQSLRWTGFFVVESQDHAFWVTTVGPHKQPSELNSCFR